MEYDKVKHLQELKGGQVLIKTIDFDNLKFDDLMRLKKFYKNINNLITYELAVKGINWLKNNNFISDEEDYYNRINNSKGYDIDLHEKEIIAEVKCNIPVDGDKFGSQQKNGIMNDVNRLLDGKGKFKNKTYNLKKFLFIYKTNKIEKALKNLIAIKKFEHSKKTRIITTSSEFNMNCVNIVIIK